MGKWYPTAWVGTLIGLANWRGWSDLGNRHDMQRINAIGHPIVRGNHHDVAGDDDQFRMSDRQLAPVG